MTDSPRRADHGGTGAHAALSESTAAYVLGALEPADRAELERHLLGCRPCRERVAELASLPGLLSGVDPTTLDVEPPADLEDRALAALGVQRRRDRLRLRRWQGVAVAAVLAATLAVTAEVVQRAATDEGAAAAPTTSTPTSVPDDAPSIELVAPTGSSTVQARATLRLVAKGWGTELLMESAGLPYREAYTLWVSSSDGTRQPAASWGPTSSGRSRCVGATSIVAADMTAIEVVNGSEVLLRGSF